MSIHFDVFIINITSIVRKKQESVEYVALEILILLSQRKNMKEICCLLKLNHNNKKSSRWIASTYFTILYKIQFGKQ